MGRTLAPRQMSSADLLSRLVQVAGTAQAQIAPALAGFGLAESLAGVLWALNPEQTPVPMRELARRLHCDPSNVTLMSTKLEQAGLVERRGAPHRWADPRPGAEQRQLSALLAKIQAASAD
ncbi:MarR family winged helix-turn-helix transcriptional regulator [Nonomuraea lactucae]|uniref:MarR family winged helix-turn-helix transcriptional regulator n=1 Tax=Nonomuraea lactucae TaxID=2249762 RepID=UPI000DE38C66|nr:MarR family transcriptional regulator [Nonomuraea lactucae]